MIQSPGKPYATQCVDTPMATAYWSSLSKKWLRAVIFMLF